MDRPATARAYYRALDEDDYDLLADLLTAGFVHERPDRTIDGRDRFVRFMREERPQTDTSHPLDGVFEPIGGSDSRGSGAGDVAARGRLLAADGSEIAAFVDVFSFDGEGRIRRIRTYTA